MSKLLEKIYTEEHYATYANENRIPVYVLYYLEWIFVFIGLHIHTEKHKIEYTNYPKLNYSNWRVTTHYKLLLIHPLFIIAKILQNDYVWYFVSFPFCLVKNIANAIINTIKGDQ